MLFGYTSYRDGGDYYAFSIENLNKSLSQHNYSKNFAKKLKEIEQNYFNTNPIDKKLKNIIKEIYCYFGLIKFTPNIYNNIYLIMQNHTIDMLLIIGMFYGDKSVIKKTDNNLNLEFLDNLCEILDRIQPPYESSSNSSGCSSCSSCGGCGGGGAD